MTTIEVSSKLDPRIASFTREFVGSVIDACDPAALVRGHADLSGCAARTHVLGFGKASAGMVLECVRQLGDRFAGGVAMCPDEQIPLVDDGSGLRWFGVDHPLPTQRNIEATQKLVEYARSIPETDDCIVCISGGGSSHLCSPRDGVSLDQIISTTRELNARGATIHELNDARRSLETLKGGGLARVLAHVRHCRALVLSDVLDDDLETIASGPMLDSQAPIEHTIVGNHRVALNAAERFLGSRGGRILTQCPLCRGDASQAGRQLALRYINEPGAHLIAGETTVDAHAGSGIGGPTLELVLQAAATLREQLGDQDDWCVIGLATDGIDGPSMSAGGVITASMLPMRTLDDARTALSTHATMGMIESLGGLIRTGPTGTNVNDVALLCPLEIALEASPNG